jgi:A nuclease family of the HNH/ENDO VII superfamily with conserved AHH
LQDDAGVVFWRVVAAGLDTTVAGAAAPSNVPVIQLEPVVVVGRRMTADEIAAYDAAATRASAALASAAVAGEVWTVEALLAQGAKWFGRALVGLGELVELVPEIGLRAAGVGVSLLTLSGNAGQGQSRIQIGENQRFEVPPGALYGVLQQRDEYGDWQTTKTGVRLWEVGNQRMALTDNEIRALNAPMSNPADPRSTPPLVTPIPTDRDQMPPLPGMDMAPPDVGAIPGYEVMPPLTIADLLLDKQNSEILGDNLRAAGSAKPAEGYEAHHIVPSGAGDVRMDALRAQLVALGIDLNDAANGVWLPGPKARQIQRRRITEG